MNSSIMTNWKGKEIVVTALNIETFYGKQCRPDQTQHSAVSDLGLQYLPTSLLWDTRHKWVKTCENKFYIFGLVRYFASYFVDCTNRKWASQVIWTASDFRSGPLVLACKIVEYYRICWHTHSLEIQLNHITLVEINHEILSTVILPLLLIQEGQLSVTGKSMCKFSSSYLQLWLYSLRLSTLGKIFSRWHF